LFRINTNKDNVFIRKQYLFREEF